MTGIPCPRCATDLHCPCLSCAERNKGKITWEWVDGELERCPVCGLTLHVDMWLDQEWETYFGRRRYLPYTTA